MESNLPSFNKDIQLSPGQTARLMSLMAHQQHTEKLAAEMTTQASVLKQAVEMLLATIIDLSGGDPSAPYSLTDNGTRLQAQ